MNWLGLRRAKLALLTLFAFLLLLSTASPASAQKYLRTNLLSDIPGVALRADGNLINPWGVAFRGGPQGSPIWIANNNSGTSTLYLADGSIVPIGSKGFVRIPGPAGTPRSFVAAPTGVVFSGGAGFVVKREGQTGAAVFIFATEDGTISGWAPSVDVDNAVLMVDKSAGGTGAVYKGLALGQSKKTGKNLLFAANFRAGEVEVFNTGFQQMGTFTDANLPAGYAPFGIHNINGNLWVTFAKQNASKHDDMAGDGNGFVDVFDTDGHLLDQFAQHGTLNSPWGVALAPANFGKFSGAILVGNFGNGWISAFDPSGTHQFLGLLQDTLGNILTIQKLWSLEFGGGNDNSGPTNQLLFTAGIGDEQHGLFGTINPFTGSSNDPDN